MKRSRDEGNNQTKEITQMRNLKQLKSEIQLKDVFKKFKIQCQQNLKYTVIPKGTILYHGTRVNICNPEKPYCILQPQSFLSNRFSGAVIFSKRQRVSSASTNTPVVYKYIVEKDIKLVLFDKNNHIKCLNRKCQHGKYSKKNNYCSVDFECSDYYNKKYNNMKGMFINLVKCLELPEINLKSSVQAEILSILCKHGFGGYKWTHHENEIAICNPYETLKFQGVSFRHNNPVQNQLNPPFLGNPNEMVHWTKFTKNVNTIKKNLGKYKIR